MIIDENKKFIFIHIPKTAGTSVRSALQPTASKPKKGSPINSNKKFLRSAINTRTKHETYSEFIENFSVRTGLDENVLDDFTFITFVRNPIQRFMSLHRYLLQRCREVYPSVPEDINDFVEDVVYEKYDYLKKIRSLKTQYSFIDGIRSDKIITGRYENLLDDWKIISDRFGVRSKIAHLNKSIFDDKEMSEQCEKLISNYFAVDFEHFGY